MKVNRTSLRNILASLRPGLAKREFVPQLCHFMFSPDMITTYNDKICITHPFTNTEKPFSVKGEEFYRIIDGMGDEEITISVEETKVKIRSKGTTASMKILGDSADKLPENALNVLLSGRKGWKKLPDNFSEGISLCAFSASPDLSKGLQACVWILGSTMYSVDHARSCRFKMTSPIDTDLYLIAKECHELAKFPIIEYCYDGKWAHFRTEDDVIFSCMPMRGTYPIEKVNNVYDKFSGIKASNLPKELKSIVDNVVVLASTTENSSMKWVDVTIKGGEIFITATNELGEVEKTLTFEDVSMDILIRLNAKFLSQILDRATSIAFGEKLVYFSNGPFQHLLATVSKT